jgi:hypothetical protein
MEELIRNLAVRRVFTPLCSSCADFFAVEYNFQRMHGRAEGHASLFRRKCVTARDDIQILSLRWHCSAVLPPPSNPNIGSLSLSVVLKPKEEDVEVCMFCSY